MNKQIQELIRQVTVPADQAEDYALTNGLIEPSDKLDVGKFAELIVLKCAEIAETAEPYKSADLIKKYFGI